MKNYLLYLPLFLVPLFDQVAKIRSNYILNHNFLFGMFYELPTIYKSVIAVSFFLLIFAIYSFFLILLIPKVPLLKLSSSAFMGGVFSNCIDKMIFLGVRDHLTFDSHLYFNLADAFQLISIPVLCYSLFYYSQELWGDECLRKSFFLGVKSQIKISVNFLAILLINLILMGIFFLSFLNFIHTSQDVVYQFLKTFLIFSSALFFSSMFFILIYSQRIVGPFISFTAYLKNKNYKNQNFKVRQGDPLIELETIADLIKGNFHGN